MMNPLNLSFQMPHVNDSTRGHFSPRMPEYLHRFTDTDGILKFFPFPETGVEFQSISFNERKWHPDGHVYEVNYTILVMIY